MTCTMCMPKGRICVNDLSLECHLNDANFLKSIPVGDSMFANWMMEPIKTYHIVNNEHNFTDYEKSVLGSLHQVWSTPPVAICFKYLLMFNIS